MKLDELAEDLRRPYSTKRGYGVTKLPDAGKEWQNIYFVIPKPPPKTIPSQLPASLLSEALQIIGQLPQVQEMDSLDKLINFLFMNREVVQSSRLEGTFSTIDHVLTPSTIADANEGKSEHQAVRSYANLLEEIVKETIDKGEEIFTQEFICRVHKKIIESDPNSNGIPGKLREKGKPGSIVTIGGGIRLENSIYNPTPAFKVIDCLEETLDWFRDSELAQLGDAAIGGLSLPIRIAIGHVHFEAVHPFTDGNGRIGRALWPVQMICSGNMPLYLSGYVEAYQLDYANALEQAQKQLNYRPMIEFICHAIIESHYENVKTKKAIVDLKKAWQQRGNFRLNSGPRKALSLLLEKPIISSLIIEEELGLSKTASINTINALVKKKIIKLRRTESRVRIYAAEELIQILSRPFAGELDIALEKAHIILGLVKKE